MTLEQGQKRRRRRCYVCDKFPDTGRSLHQFPRTTDEDVYKKWLEALALNERDQVKNLRVCSRHFMSNDFINLNGTRLRAKAVPSVKVPNPPVSDHNDTPILEQEAGPIDDPESNGSVHQDPRYNNGFQVFNGAENTILVVVNNVEDSIGVEEVLLQSSCSSAEQTTRNPVEYFVLDQKVSLGRGSDGHPSMGSLDIATTESNCTDPLDDSEEAVQVLNRVDGSNRFKAQNRVNMLQKPTATEHYNLAALKRDLKRNELPLHWCFTVDKDKISFHYYGDYPEVATRSIFVKDDMSVEVKSRGLVFSKHTLGPIKDKLDLVFAMTFISKLSLCVGIDGECCGESLVVKSIKKNPSKRCVRCREAYRSNSKTENAGPGDESKEDEIEVSRPAKRRRKDTDQGAAHSPDMVVLSPVHLEEVETSLIDNEVWSESIDKDPLKMEGSDCSPSPSVIDEEDDVTKRFAVNSFTVPRYLLDILSARLRRSRQETRSVKDSLHVQTMLAESLARTNDMLLGKIAHLKGKLTEVESIQSFRQIDKSVFTQSSDATIYNMQQAKKDLDALQNKKMMPRHWSFITTSAGILLFLDNNVGHPHWPLAACLLIRPDMALDIRLWDKPVPNYDLGQMKSIQDILAAMKSVVGLRICIGVDKICLGDGYFRKATSIGQSRCEKCRPEWKRYSRKERSRARMLAAKSQTLRETKLELRKLNRRLKSSNTAAEKDKQEIARLKQVNLRLMKLKGSVSMIGNSPSAPTHQAVTANTSS